jgi:hypothetical protein
MTFARLSDSFCRNNNAALVALVHAVTGESIPIFPETLSDFDEHASETLVRLHRSSLARKTRMVLPFRGHLVAPQTELRKSLLVAIGITKFEAAYVPYSRAPNGTPDTGRSH